MPTSQPHLCGYLEILFKVRGVCTAMFERFTEKAIKVIMLAQEEARRLGHNFVGTEQILLGLIGEGTGIAAKTLKSMGVNLKDARQEVEKIIGRLEQGVFTWAEWAEALSREVHRPGRAADGADYFDCWVAALSMLLSERGVASEGEQAALSDRWARAAEATPHGKPILLENAPA